MPPGSARRPGGGARWSGGVRWPGAALTCLPRAPELRRCASPRAGRMCKRGCGCTCRSGQVSPLSVFRPESQRPGETRARLWPGIDLRAPAHPAARSGREQEMRPSHWHVRREGASGLRDAQRGTPRAHRATIPRAHRAVPPVDRTGRAFSVIVLPYCRTVRAFSVAVPPGRRTVRAFGRTVPPGSRVVRAFRVTVPPGSRAVRVLGGAVPPGRRTVPPGGRAVPPAGQALPPVDRTTLSLRGARKASGRMCSGTGGGPGARRRRGRSSPVLTWSPELSRSVPADPLSPSDPLPAQGLPWAAGVNPEPLSLKRGMLRAGLRFSNKSSIVWRARSTR